MKEIILTEEYKKNPEIFLHVVKDMLEENESVVILKE